jgi:hypothetical protein
MILTFRGRKQANKLIYCGRSGSTGRRGCVTVGIRTPSIGREGGKTSLVGREEAQRKAFLQKRASELKGPRWEKLNIF